MQYGFKNEKRYELVKKYLGNPPCSICLVQPMCLQMVTNPDDGYYEPVCDKPCTEADEWFNYGTCLGYIFDWKNKSDINELLLKDSKDPDKIKENIIKLKKMVKP